MTLNIANRLELFVDDYLIERKTNLCHHLHRPTPCETVFTFDKPWEGNASGCSTLLHDGEKYRLYYRGWHYHPELIDREFPPNNYCVAYSDDGLNFYRPSLGKVSFQGCTDNNILLEGPDFHAFSPFIDTRPGTPADERYKAIATTSGDNELMGHVSSDGLAWRLIQENPIIDRSRSAFDSMNLAFWSEHENCYVCYGRDGSHGTRTISRFTSTDFLNWEGPFPMQFGGTPREELYTSGTLPYPRAPHIYLAFAKRFVQGASPLTEAQAEALEIIPSQRGDVSDGVLLSSRGGNRFDRLFMEAFVPPGRDPGNWAARSHLAVWGMAQLSSDELSLYYSEHYSQPTNGIKRYSLRVDGFISLRAPWHGGEMVTKPLLFSGKTLTMNFATSAAGSIKVEIQQPNGQPIAGYALDDATTMTGDYIEQQVKWKEGADVSALAGQPVRLRFVMRDADLYAFRFSE